MGRKNSIEIAFDKIEAYFDHLLIKSFTEKNLRDILQTKQNEWGLSISTKVSRLIDFLEYKEVLFSSAFYNEENNVKVIYSWKTRDDLTIIAGLKKSAYFTHYTAMVLHQLTLQIPKTYYLNSEHSSEMSTESNLTQENIDGAFSKPQRKTSHNFTYKSEKVLLINGKHTGKLGVIRNQTKEQSYEYTDLERTLIDIAIRPVYSGGVFEVLEAYKKVIHIADIKKLLTYIKKLNFIYPYHQVIGFYLEKAGYPESALTLFEKDIHFNFYLTYDIRNKEYSQRWKLYFPKGI